MVTQSLPSESSIESTSHHLFFVTSFCAIISVLALIIQKCSSGLHLRGVTLNRSVQNAHAVPRLYSSGFPVVTAQRSRPDPNSRAKLWKLFRLAACFALVMISITAIALADTCQNVAPNNNTNPSGSNSVSELKYGYGHGGGRGRKHKSRHLGDFCLSQPQTEQLSIGVFYVYVTILALLAVALESRFRRICNIHVVILLLLSLALDFWVLILPIVTPWLPSPTYTPLECVSLGRTAILAFAAVVVPIFVQRAYAFRDQEAKSFRRNGSTVGRLVAKNLTARLSPRGPPALKRISFTIDPGERVCVIGNDENGRRALVLSLLRAAPTAGKVYLDGISTHTIAQEALRAHITFISQNPETLPSTVRQTLNPQGLHGDVELESALRSLGLEISLDITMTELSGELKGRLLLTKAIVCRSKIVILDEGDDDYTSAIRFTIQTRLPQSTLIILTSQVQLARDVEKVMVLDGDRVAEFGPPGDLLRKWSGPFKTMVNASESRDELYKIFRK